MNRHSCAVNEKDTVPLLQARRNAEDVSNNLPQPFGAAPPQAVLGFAPKAPTHAKRPSSTALQTDAEQASVKDSALSISQARQAGQTNDLKWDTEPKAKDYGAPWAAAAAAEPASENAQSQVTSTTAAEGLEATPPSTSMLFGHLPIDSSADAEPSPSLDQPGFAPSPFTAPPKKPFDLFQDMATSKPSAFSRLGASTSATAVSESIAAAAPANAAACHLKATVSEAKSADALHDAGNALAPASLAPQAAAQPSFPSFPSSTFSAQPSAQQQHPGFTFGPSAPVHGSQPAEPEALQTQAQEAAVSSGNGMSGDAAHQAHREASVSSDASGDTSVAEQLYPFSSQRSAQDRLEGLMAANHQAADDAEGYYRFGQTGRSLADQNKAEPVAGDEQDQRVTPLQVVLRLPHNTTLLLQLLGFLKAGLQLDCI